MTLLMIHVDKGFHVFYVFVSGTYIIMMMMMIIIIVILYYSTFVNVVLFGTFVPNIVYSNLCLFCQIKFCVL